jgi:hypothetical protein
VIDARSAMSRKYAHLTVNRSRIRALPLVRSARNVDAGAGPLPPMMTIESEELRALSPDLDLRARFVPVVPGPSRPIEPWMPQLMPPYRHRLLGNIPLTRILAPICSVHWISCPHASMLVR